MGNIPLAVLKPLTEAWNSSEYALTKFAYQIENHSQGDKKSGLTSRYFFNEGGGNGDSLTTKELSAIIKTGIIPDAFYNEHEGCRSICEI